MIESSCRVCGATLRPELVAREMMFGTRETFAYGSCESCGAVQLLEVPQDLGRHYPAGYYSFAPEPRAGARMWLRRARNRLAIAPRGWLGGCVARLFAHRATPWFQHMGVDRNARILDVGCGSGELLVDLAEAGFTSLTGVDPFVAADMMPAPGVRVVKGTLDDVHGTFDLVMFHHSLEHMADQLGALRAAARVLAPGGWCLVRVPTVSSFAWETYRQHWVQLDAPRHIVLHSRGSLERAGRAAGLTLEGIVDDSTEFQFTGSELYRRDIPLMKLPGVYSRRERRRFRREAERLNHEGRGDQAAFYFRPGT